MPLKRSRPKTEQKFLHAVLELVAREGCSALGINAVAHSAGADKVLIYRYFNNLDGLLERVAHSREWLPKASELVNSLSLSAEHEACDVLQQIAQHLVQHIRADKATHQLVCWRKADKNPLTDYFTDQWQAFWHELSDSLSIGLDYAARENWKRISALTALVVEAELCGEPVDLNHLQLFANDISVGQLSEDASAAHRAEAFYEEQLPTNLL